MLALPRFPTSSRRAAAVALLAGLLLPSGAEAKITCASPPQRAQRSFEGLPSKPLAGVAYEAEIRTASRNNANPEPLLFVLRCEGAEDREFVQLTPIDPQGGSADGRRRFRVEFERAGDWRIALMDRAGRFFDAGRYAVRSPRAPIEGGVEEDGSGPVAVVALLGGVVVAAAGVLSAVRRPRTGSPSRG